MVVNLDIAITVVWIGILLLNMYVEHKDIKSNKEVESEIDFLEKLVDKDLASNKNLLKQVENLTEAAKRKSTAQDNLLWQSIIILANEISNLEGKSDVKKRN